MVWSESTTIYIEVNNMERLSISISSNMKMQLELMAKSNFRNLNGEINKALDDYIKGIGVDINAPNWWEDEPKEQECKPQQQPIEPIRHQPEPMVHQKAPIITTLLNNDEIEEF